MDAQTKIPITHTDDGKIEFDVNDLFKLIRMDAMKKWPPHRMKPTVKRSSASFKRVQKRLRYRLGMAAMDVKIAAGAVRNSWLQRNVELALREYGVSWRQVEKEAHQTGMQILHAGRHLLRIYANG